MVAKKKSNGDYTFTTSQHLNFSWPCPFLLHTSGNPPPPSCRINSASGRRSRRNISRSQNKSARLLLQRAGPAALASKHPAWTGASKERPCRRQVKDFIGNQVRERSPSTADSLSVPLQSQISWRCLQESQGSGLVVRSSLPASISANERIRICPSCTRWEVELAQWLTLPILSLSSPTERWVRNTGEIGVNNDPTLLQQKQTLGFNPYRWWSLEAVTVCRAKKRVFRHLVANASFLM